MNLLLTVPPFQFMKTTHYMYLREPPIGTSPLFFLPWPWYIPFVSLVALGLFYVAWLPFCRSKNLAARGL